MNVYILHIETSTKICSIALSSGHELLESRDILESMNHTALLTPAIEQLMKTTGIRLNALAAISVSSGPGSYTGLRVGSSTAKAIAYTLQIPILAVPTLLSLATAVFNKYPDMEVAMPMLDARRNEVYTALYDRKLNELVPMSSMILDQIHWNDMLPTGKSVICCGEGSMKPGMAPARKGLAIDSSIQCKAAYLVEPALRLFAGGQYSNPMHFVPFYLKPPNITQGKEIT